MNRRFFFSAVTSALAAFWLRLFPARCAPGAPVLAKAPVEDITASILRQHRQVIVNAFSADSYMSNLMDVENALGYDTSEYSDNFNAAFQRMKDHLSSRPRGSFTAYLEAESRILQEPQS